MVLHRPVECTALIKHVDCIRVARQPKAPAITPNNPAYKELTAMVQFKDALTALAARPNRKMSINANQKACST
jgi:hypothetical protein